MSRLVQVALPTEPIDASPDEEEIEVEDDDPSTMGEAARLARHLRLDAKKEKEEKRKAAKEAWENGRADRVAQAIAKKRQEEAERADRIAQATKERRQFEAGREDRIAQKVERRRAEEATRAERVAKKAEQRRMEEANRPLKIALAAASRRSERPSASPEDEDIGQEAASPNDSPTASSAPVLEGGVRILKERESTPDPERSPPQGSEPSEDSDLEVTEFKPAPPPIRRVVEEALAEDVSRKKFDEENATKEKELYDKIDKDLNKSVFNGIAAWHENARKQKEKAHKKEMKKLKKAKKTKKKSEEGGKEKGNGRCSKQVERRQLRRLVQIQSEWCSWFGR